MKKLSNILFFVFLPWPVYILLSYHFLSTMTRGIVSIVVIVIGILSGLSAVILNWIAYKKNKELGKTYPIVFSVAFFAYLLSLVWINIF